MQAVLQLIGQLLGMLSEVLGITQQIRGLVKPLAVELEPYKIDGNTSLTQAIVANPTFGNSALHTDMASIAADVSTLIGAVNLLSAQVGSPAQSATPPDWWASPSDPADIADAVWDYQSGAQTIGPEYYALNMGTLLPDVWSWISYQTGWTGVPCPNNPYFAFVQWEPFRLADTWVNWTDFDGSNVPALPDWSLALSSDTVYSFLARTQPLAGWSNEGPSGVISDAVAWIEYEGTGGQRGFIRSNFTELDMLALAGGSTPPSTPVLVAPVWPGLAGATVGASSALSDGMTISGPMHGLVLAITSAPSGAGRYNFGGTLSYTHCGAVIFCSDRGDYELPIPIGLQSFVVCPKTMQVAASAKLRLGAGFVGTVRPWSIA